MGHTIYWMNVSIDLRIEHETGEHGAGRWIRITEDLHRAFNARAAKLALMIQGRVIYETMEGFWPRAAHDTSLPDFMRDYGRIWTDKPKVLLSNTRRDASHNTRIVGGNDAMEQLATLRRETEGDIGVGGATVATQMLRAGLLDEMLLFVHPIVLGRGRSLFDEPDLVNLELIEHEVFSSGVAMHRYAVQR